MPQAATVERRPEVTGTKVVKQYYQGWLSERLMQAGSMFKDRALLRRGSRKMQDGTLGQKGSDNAVENDAMNIHIGDLVVTQAEPSPPPATPPPTSPLASTLKQLGQQRREFFMKAAISAALFAPTSS